MAHMEILWHPIVHVVKQALDGVLQVGHQPFLPSGVRYHWGREPEGQDCSRLPGTKRLAGDDHNLLTRDGVVENFKGTQTKDLRTIEERIRAAQQLAARRANGL